MEYTEEEIKMLRQIQGLNRMQLDEFLGQEENKDDTTRDRQEH